MRIQEIRDGVMRLIRLPLRTRTEIDADADAELDSFLAERIDSLVARGLSASEARQEALRRLGPSLTEASQLLHHSARTRERRMNMRELVDDFMQDLRYSFRTLRRDVRFAIFAIVIIGLGVGASVTVFSVANAMLIRPLPFRQPERLVWIPNTQGDGLSGSTSQVNSILGLIEANRSFAAIGGYFAFSTANDTKLTANRETVRLSALPVTQNFFDVLGVTPLIGRGFSDQESAYNGPKAVMLSYSLWQRRFNSDKNIVGKVLVLNDAPTTVIGVLPQAFNFGAVFVPGARIDFFTPFPMTDETNRWGNTMSLVGRLKPGIAVSAAQAEALIITKRLHDANPNTNFFKPAVVSLREHVSGSVQSALVVLALAVGVVMLIVCANLSNLLLARATTRQKEIAVRVALGAGKQRLVRQMLTESLVLSICGATLGLILAIAGTRIIAGLNGMNLPLLSEVRVDGVALGFAALLAIVAGVAFGLMPALQIPSAGVHGALKESSRSSTGGNRGKVVRSALVISEIALACMLLVGAGLLARSFLKVMDVDMGFKAESVASLRVDPGSNYTATEPAFVAYIDEVLRLSRAVPGVQQVGISDGLPLGSNRTWGIAAKENGAYPQSEWPQTFVHIVSDGYLGAMNIRVKAGRDFTAGDDNKGDAVIIINETLARTLFKGADPIGRLVRTDRERTVVGVVADVRLLSLEKGGGAEMYLPIRQLSDYSSVNLVFRSQTLPATAAQNIRTALLPLVPDLPVGQISIMQDIVDTSVSPRRFMTVLLGGFAGFALLLALLGIYGVISYTVNHRTQEIGVRMALGATATQLQMRIIRETLTLAALGMVIGTVASWMLARTLGSLLFGVSAADPLTFAAMLVVLTVVATASGYFPARRASRIDPMMALRGS
ncbi:MAG: ABC transporter permease [Gemmatimonadaceae bacterium]